MLVHKSGKTGSNRFSFLRDFSVNCYGFKLILLINCIAYFRAAHFQTKAFINCSILLCGEFAKRFAVDDELAEQRPFVRTQF